MVTHVSGLITYLHAMISVAQPQLPAGHHGLLGVPALSTDQSPALGSVSVGVHHLHAPLVECAPPRDADLCGAKGLGSVERSTGHGRV